LFLLLLFFEVRIQRLGLFVETSDFIEKGLHHLALLDMADRHASLEDDSFARSGRDAQVGFLGLAKSIDQAAQDTDPERVFQVFHLVFNFGDDALEVDVVRAQICRRRVRRADARACRERRVEVGSPRRYVGRLAIELNVGGQIAERRAAPRGARDVQRTAARWLVERTRALQDEWEAHRETLRASGELDG